jgi:hypothetical protein
MTPEQLGREMFRIASVKLFHSSKASPAEMRGGMLCPTGGVLWLAETPYASTLYLRPHWWLYTVTARPPAITSWNKKAMREGRAMSPLAVGWWMAKAPLPWADVRQVRRKDIEIGEAVTAPSGVRFRHAVYVGAIGDDELLLRAPILIEARLLEKVAGAPRAMQ